MFVIFEDGLVHKGTGTLIGVLLGYALIILALYILMSVGFYTIAKRKGIKNAYLAYIPFVRWLIAGKIIKKAIIFGKPTQKIGVILTITSALYIGLTLIYTFIKYYVFIRGMFVGQSIVVLSTAENLASEIYLIPTTTFTHMVDGAGKFVGSVDSLTPYSFKNAYSYYVRPWAQTIGDIAYYLNMIVSLVHVLVTISFWNAFFRGYKPNSVFMYTVVSAFVPWLVPFFEVGGIFVFIFRNREEIDIEELMRKMYQNAYNPYANPYANQYNNPNSDPYGREFDNNGSAKPNQPSDNPFGEFENNNHNDDPFS